MCADDEGSDASGEGCEHQPLAHVGVGPSDRALLARTGRYAGSAGVAPSEHSLLERTKGDKEHRKTALTPLACGWQDRGLQLH